MDDERIPPLMSWGFLLMATLVLAMMVIDVFTTIPGALAYPALGITAFYSGVKDMRRWVRTIHSRGGKVTFH